MKGGHMTALEAVEELAKCDHGILTREGGLKLWEAMGLDGTKMPCFAIEHQPATFKGASLKGCTEAGQKRMGVGADDLASFACGQLKLEYAEKFGRGSQLRECIGALYRHFGGK
jgi:hypothetical protein